MQRTSRGSEASASCRGSANAGYRSDVLSAMLRGKPICGLASDIGRDHMATLELPVAHLVAGALELGYDPAAAAVDREPSVARPVRDKEPRGAPLSSWRHESRREREHVREQVSVHDPERERVGGSVRVATDGEVRRIHRVAAERVL